MRGHSFVLGLVAVAAVVLPPAARADEVEALRRELEAMRGQFETMRQQYERRMQELGERLRTLETRPPATSVVRPPATPVTAPAATSVTAPPASTSRGALSAAAAPATATDAASGPTPLEIITPRQPFALAQPGSALLFDIGASGDFVADFTSNRLEQRHDGTFDGRENRFFPREVSLALFGRVDPYAAAVVRMTAGEESPGETGREAEISVKLEEANVTLLTLPLDTTARFGLMRPRFGTLNTVHQDDLPQVDRPNVLKQFLGEEELNGEKGLEAYWLLPLPFYEELSAGVFNGDNEQAFGQGSLRDPLVVGRLRSFFELEELGGLQVDLSAATGVTTQDRRNTLAGIGLKYKWAPATGYGFPLITLAGELLYGNRGVRDMGVDRWLERWGAYVYGQYDWTRRWAAGLRYDWTESPVASGRQWALSPYLQFKPSEFLRFRVQYKHTSGTGSFERDADELFLQGSFILGAHPTERF
jgi:hypothetical protein